MGGKISVYLKEEEFRMLRELMRLEEAKNHAGRLSASGMVAFAIRRLHAVTFSGKEE
jgi:hypothetical protein